MWTDKKSMQYFLDIQNKLNPTMSIEVGAFDADFSIEISKRNIPTYAFEAFPDIHDRFKNRLLSINYLNIAIADYDGYSSFYFISDDQKYHLDQGFFSIKEGGYAPKAKRTTISVPCTSLDSYFKDLNNEKIVLWIDCEGANREVLNGSLKILSMVDSIYIEVEHENIWEDQWIREDVINFLENFDFVLLDEFKEQGPQSNCIFIKKHLLNLV